MRIKTKRVVVYLPEQFMDTLRRAYTECDTDGEILVKHLMEIHAGWTEHRDFSTYLTVIAQGYLLTRYGEEYLRYVHPEMHRTEEGGEQ